MKSSIRRPARFILVLLVLAPMLAGLPSFAAARVVTDSAGRRVEVPERVERVYAAGAPASIFVYAIAPDKLVGWNRAPTPAEKAFLPARYAELPAVGRLTGRGNTANVEVVLAAKPDVIVDVGTLGPTFASLADRVQQQTGIPYVLFDGSFAATAKTAEALGEILGATDQGRRLARYTERLLAELDERVARVPDDRRPRVYYARGPKGLESGAQGSINTESLARLRARNVVWVRLAVIGAATLMTAAVVSISGVIGWIGLLVPHFARLLVGPDFGRLLPAAMLLGSAYLLAVDTLARPLAPIEIPLGVLTAVIGAPFFLWLLATSRRGWS